MNFRFFWGGLIHPEGRSVPNRQHMKKLVIFASGAGTNARHLIHSFRDSPLARVSLIVCNKPGAGVLQVAAEEEIPYLVVQRDSFFHSTEVVQILQALPADLIVLAGFLWKVPDALLQAFPGKIINIHPALLPKYGGKGMYGLRVHEAVIAAKDRQSGITIHYVNEVYDSGETILQKTCPVTEGETAESLAQKVHQLEYTWYPKVIEQLLRGQKPE
jgi:phosphoribosylglycinamide formyltransferase-1